MQAKHFLSNILARFYYFIYTVWGTSMLPIVLVNSYLLPLNEPVFF